MIVNGFFGKDLTNTADMPISDEELARRGPPTKVSRAVYIGFGMVLFVYGVVRIF